MDNLTDTFSRYCTHAFGWDESVCQMMYNGHYLLIFNIYMLVYLLTMVLVVYNELGLHT